MFASRQAKLRELLSEGDYGAFLIFDPLNIYYATGFTGALSEERFSLILTPDGAILPTDFRYLELAKEEAEAEVYEIKQRAYDELAALLPEGTSRVAFEAGAISYTGYGKLEEALKDIELIPAGRLVEELRLRKDEVEVEMIRRAAAIADAAFEHALGVIEPGVSEREVALEIECFMRRRGADKAAFEIIVASGRHSAIPHASPTDKPLVVGNFITIDLGARVEGYCSDMTRTVVLGEPDDEQREIHRTILAAQARALARVEPGVHCTDVDAAAREFIDSGNFAGKFAHGCGHGVGLDVHEAPTLAKRSEETLEPGMVVTVEPGIYIEGKLGARIEDLVLVTENGYELLSHATRELIEL